MILFLTTEVQNQYYIYLKTYLETSLVFFFLQGSMSCCQKILCMCGCATSFCPGSYPKPKATRLECQSRLSASDKSDNEMICPIAEETPGKSHLGDRLMKAMRPVIVSNWVPCLQMRSVESHNMSGREKGGMNEDYTPSGDINSITIALNGSV
jgi:hypothetical protein